MAPKALPSQEVLRQLLDYNADTGALTWRERGVEWFNPAPAARRTAQHVCETWNTRYAGTPALHCVPSHGYRTGALLGGSFRAHRVCWKWAYGTEPEMIDHINGDTTDNRIENLRSVSNQINSQNQKRRPDNVSGIPGVRLHMTDRSARWHVSFDKRYRGSFRCWAQAVALRRKLQAEAGYHKNHGREALK